MTRDEHKVQNIKELTGFITIINNRKQVTFLLLDVYNALRIRDGFNKYYRHALSMLEEGIDYKHIWRKKDVIYDLDSPYVFAVNEKRLMRLGYHKGVLLTTHGLHMLLQQSVVSNYLSDFKDINYTKTDIFLLVQKRKPLKKYYNMF